MADAKKELKTLMMPMYLVLALAVVGIILMVYGIMNEIIALIVVGPIMAFVPLVFIVPLVWIRNGERRINLRLAVIALQGERTAFSVLAGSVGCSDAEARERIVWCLNNGYLPGYVISGNEVLLSKLMDPNLQEHAVECPNCGASFTYVGKIGQCPYCGDYYPPQNKH